MALLDAFDCCISDYHLGLSCITADAVWVLRNNLKPRDLTADGPLPRVRIANGPQFVAKQFEEAYNELEIVHEDIPVKRPSTKRSY